MLTFEIGHLMTSSFGVICSQMSNPVCKQHSMSKLIPFCFLPVLTAFSLVGQALTLLVREDRDGRAAGAPVRLPSL